MFGLNDTSISAHNAQISILRKKTPSERLALAFSLSDTVIQMAKRAVRRVHPEWTEEQVKLRFIELHYSKELAAEVASYMQGRHMAAFESKDMVAALQPVVEALEALGVTYYIGGSVASTVYGAARATLDVDMVSNLKKEHIPELVSLLKDRYYISEELILHAISHSSSFNLVHLDTAMKIDIFITKRRAYDFSAVSRIREDSIAEGGSSSRFYVAAPEDVILAKLEWFKQGGSVSERQWTDILGVLEVQENQLDVKYLQTWAKELGVDDLLERVMQQAQRSVENT